MILYCLFFGSDLNEKSDFKSNAELALKSKYKSITATKYMRTFIVPPKIGQRIIT